MKKIASFVVAICALGLLGAVAENPKEKSKSHAAMSAEKHVVLNTGEMQWGDAPPFLPAGAKFALLQGEPGKKGVYTIRLKVPSGYRIPPHIHPTTENVSVISGAMNFGMGCTFDEKNGRKIKAGGFASMPARMAHFHLGQRRDSAAGPRDGTVRD